MHSQALVVAATLHRHFARGHWLCRRSRRGNDEADNPGILNVQGDFNRAPPGLLEQLNIATLGSEPTTTASVSEAPSMAPLDLGPITTASAPPSQSINPNTLASLESVGLPFFQAKDGGLASIESKKFKKPQVVS